MSENTTTEPMKNGEIIYKNFPDKFNDVILVEDNNIIFVNTNFRRKAVLNLLLDEKEANYAKTSGLPCRAKQP